MKVYLRLHFYNGIGYLGDGGNLQHRAMMVQVIKENFNVPKDVELCLVRNNWLNINMKSSILREVLEFLDSLPLKEGYGVFNVYPMDEASKKSRLINSFMKKNNFTGC